MAKLTSQLIAEAQNHGLDPRGMTAEEVKEALINAKRGKLAGSPSAPARTVGEDEASLSELAEALNASQEEAASVALSLYGDGSVPKADLPELRANADEYLAGARAVRSQITKANVLNGLQIGLAEESLHAAAERGQLQAEAEAGVEVNAYLNARVKAMENRLALLYALDDRQRRAREETARALGNGLDPEAVVRAAGEESLKRRKAGELRTRQRPNLTPDWDSALSDG